MLDLTTSFPRSTKEHMAGLVMIARTTDKAKAKAHGNIGEYHYNCPMDVRLFTFLGIDHEAFLDKVANAKDDHEIEAYVKSFADKKTPAEIAQWNTTFLQYAPAPGSEGETYFLDLRNSLDASRTDITVWADLLDLDEKRDVPRKVAV
jgi:hypothetical protein